MNDSIDKVFLDIFVLLLYIIHLDDVKLFIEFEENIKINHKIYECIFYLSYIVAKHLRISSRLCDFLQKDKNIFSPIMNKKEINITFLFIYKNKNKNYIFSLKELENMCINLPSLKYISEPFFIPIIYHQKIEIDCIFT